MIGATAYRSVAVCLVAVLALTVGSAKTARAGGDLPKILAGAAVGYLIYKALDDADGRGQDRCQRCDPHRRYNPPCTHAQVRRPRAVRKAYDSGYRDGWQDGTEYGYERGWGRGKKVGFRQGYRVGYQNSDWGRFERTRRHPSSTRWSFLLIKSTIARH